MAKDTILTEKTSVYTLGELIHNPAIVQELEEQGIHIANKAEEVKNSTVIDCSHGITKKKYKILKDNNNEIIDATCPYVKRTHTILKHLVKERLSSINSG